MGFTSRDTEFCKRADNAHLTPAIGFSGFGVADADFDVAFGAAVGDYFDGDFAVAVEAEEGRVAPGTWIGVCGVVVEGYGVGEGCADGFVFDTVGDSAKRWWLGGGLESGLGVFRASIILLIVRIN